MIDEAEELCRLICRAENVDPDQASVGCGGVIEKDKPYKLWEARKRVADLMIAEGWHKSHASIELYYHITARKD